MAMEVDLSLKQSSVPRIFLGYRATCRLSRLPTSSSYVSGHSTIDGSFDVSQIFAPPLPVTDIVLL
jgi:hypothetical protein